jgi:DNA-binding transcriptional MocR family regulator
LEDAPYLYINYAAPEDRAQTFLSIDPAQTIHLFTGSKIGFPGPRVGYLYSDASIKIDSGEEIPLATLALTESSADLLFQNPAALRGFEALLHKRNDDGSFSKRDSMWPLAEDKLGVYRENRKILLETLERELGQYKDHFAWTVPDGGFFSVFTFKRVAGQPEVKTDDVLIEQMVKEHGIVVIPMYDFYPADARQRDPGAGMNQLRLSFCFSESQGDARRTDMQEAVEAFSAAAKRLVGLS